MRDPLFIKFFKTAGLFGGGSVILAIALFLIAIVEHLRDKNVEGSWLIFLACAAFCGGAYRAWDVEHSRAEEALDKLGEFQQPKFAVSITLASLGDSEKETLLLIIHAIVKNHGAPSSAYIKRVYLRFPDGTEIRAIPVPPPSEKFVLSNDGVPFLTLWRKDLLTAKITEAVLPHNGVAVGWLPYQIPAGISRSKIENAQMILTIADLNDNPTSSEPFPNSVGRPTPQSSTLTLSVPLPPQE